MAVPFKLVLVLLNCLVLCTCDFSKWVEDFMQLNNGVFWPNATVPFFIDPLHFDKEQTLSIMRSLALFGFRTCIKFLPTLVLPEGNSHVMLIENPEGIKKCHIDNKGSNVDGPHRVVLGYNCLTSPNIEMVIMKNLGFTFEHNRADRDQFISVQTENVQPMALELFTKDKKMPVELASLPYDYNSVMHFDTRQFSKNGHRTIIFKDHHVRQERSGLSPIDIRKIDIVYGPECRRRDRQEKLELCQNYPGVARRKRDVASDESVTVTQMLPLDDTTINLRVNRAITPPADVAGSHDPEDVSVVLKELGIETQVEEIVEHVHKVTALALEKAHLKYCNGSKLTLRAGAEVVKTNTSDILEIVERISDYAKMMVVRATTNLTAFCESSKSVDHYQRSCPFFNKDRCPKTYRSTKSGPVRYSTQHRPIIQQSTRHWGLKKKHSLRANDDADQADEPEKEASESDKSVTEITIASDAKPNNHDESEKSRRKRDISTENPTSLASDASVTSSDVEVNSSDIKATPSDSGVTPSDIKATPSDSGVTPSDIKATPTEVNVQHVSIVNKTKHNMRRRNVYRPGRSQGKRRPKKNPLPEQDEEATSPEAEAEEQQQDTPEERREKPRRGTKPRTVKLSKQNKEFYGDRRWPRGLVPYMISEKGNYDINAMRARIEEVNAILKEKTCAQLLEISAGQASQYPDYLVLDTSPDYVTGHVGGRQKQAASSLVAIPSRPVNFLR